MMVTFLTWNYPNNILCGGIDMIKIENVDVTGWEHAIRGMRNPMNSWAKSDTVFGLSEDFYTDMEIGKNDLSLMTSLVKAGTDHRKFMRMIVVYLDITAPLYWWKEFDTYKVGTVANSCSTMHKIHDKEFTLDDFSHEHLNTACLSHLQCTIDILNETRNYFVNGLDTGEYAIPKGDKDTWWQMIQLLPSSYNQKRTVILNYEVLVNMYHARKAHKLDEWREFCKWIESLPYSELITQQTANLDA